MAEVELRMTPQAAHIRTARQVTALLARRAGLDDEQVDDVRLAVGEACGLLVDLHRRQRPEDPVSLLVDDDDGLLVAVAGSAALDGALDDEALRTIVAAVETPGEEAGEAMLESLALPRGAAVEVLQAVVPLMRARTGPDGVRIAMRWPQDRRNGTPQPD